MALAEAQRRLQDAETDLQLATKDAKEATHREAEALADLERAVEVGAGRSEGSCEGGGRNVALG